MGEVIAAFSHGSAGGLRSSASHTSFFDSSTPHGFPRRKSSSFSDLRLATSPSSSRTSSVKSASGSSSFSLGSQSDSDDSDDDDDDDDERLPFPDFSNTRRGRIIDENRATPPASPAELTRPNPSPADSGDAAGSPSSPPDLPLISEDDTAVKVEPSQHVDYLSYEWREEDIWSSWRHIVEHRSVYGERSRLENASWRTWAKNQFRLRTVNPETLNWSKECDVTWLYGPLQPGSKSDKPPQVSEPPSRLSKTNSFLAKKPILKKRTMSEVMLQNSISSSCLVKQAAAEVQAQERARGTPLERRRHRPILVQAASDFTPSAIPSRTISRDPTEYFSSQASSGMQTPEGERKHIRFDEKVEQCIAVELKGDDDDDDDDTPDWTRDDSSDEDMVMMKRAPRKRRPLARSNSSRSVNGETKIIAKLEPTTLKSRNDSPEVGENQQYGHSLFGFYRSTRLSPSASQETLRPSNPSTNFLLAQDDQSDEEDDAFDGGRSSATTYPDKRPSTPVPRVGDSQNDPIPPEEASQDSNSSSSPLSGSGLKRTASGMIMPLPREEEDPPPPGIIGKVVGTVNTARDIVHVIMNAGWRA